MTRGAAVGLSVLAALLGLLQVGVLLVVVAVSSFEENFIDIGIDGGGFGTGADVARLTDECLGGDMVSCDTLYLNTPVGSEGEAIGQSCGNRNDPAPNQCAVMHGPVFGEDAGAIIGSDSLADFGYGDDPGLDLLWDGCDGGDLVDCDDLYFQSPVGSAYEAFGATCGDRVAATSQGRCDETQPPT